MYFTYGGHRRFEIEMRTKPNHRKRGGGMIISFSSHLIRDSTQIKNGPEIAEKSYQELLSILLEEIKFQPITNRVNRILGGKGAKERLYQSEGHRNRFISLIKNEELPLVDFAPAYTSALFLLTADDFLWYRIRKSITPNAIDFSLIDIRGVNRDEYRIFQTARSLYQGGQLIMLSDLIDPKVIEDQLFCLIFNAFLVRRYGKIICKEIGKENKLPSLEGEQREASLYIT